MPIPSRCPSWTAFFLIFALIEVPSPAGADSSLFPRTLRAHSTGQTRAGDAPDVAVTAPNGGENWAGGSEHTVSWTANDPDGISSVDIFYRDGELEDWTVIAKEIANSGSFQWFLHNTPTTQARVRVVARDTNNNEGEDTSDLVFTILQQPGGIVGTTLRDFHQPGTQPLGGGNLQDPSSCGACHGYYDEDVEPMHGWQGTMMAQAARDPLFYACLAIAEQDAPSSGDLCIRCHSPMGWLGGRSQPTDGTQLTASDRNGVSCDFCHRLVDPIYDPGENPPEDQYVLGQLAEVPTVLGNGQYVVDPDPRRRGPFSDPMAPHPWLESSFHRSSDLCGTCHDVSNPVFERVSGQDYAPGPLDEEPSSMHPGVLLPLERTYSEWTQSDFPGGVYAPDFAGNKLDGVVSTCQDCHMRDAEGQGCNSEYAPLRSDLPLHDMMGGSSWMPTILDQVYPSEVDPEALADGSARAVAMLQKAALLDLFTEPEGDSFRVDVTVTNRTGHKLPTGYPEGRRMWLNVVAYDGYGSIVYESGAYDAPTGELIHDAEVMIYEAKMGLSPGFASSTGLDAGESFHFALNDSLYKDNRIPPMGFTNLGFAAFGGAPVDPDHEGQDPRYADGQHWDVSSYPLPSTTQTVAATLYYQSVSKEYIEFLRDENTTNTSGQDMYDLWADNGRAAPVIMVTDTIAVGSSGAPGAGLLSEKLYLAGPNPFSGSLKLGLVLSRPETIVMEVFDPQGRRVSGSHLGVLGAGPHLLTWNGIVDGGNEAGSGVYWVRVVAGEDAFVRRVVRIR